MIKIAFFDTKEYDKEAFDRACKRYNCDEDCRVDIKYFETKLGADTVDLAKGCDAVCAFVNDVVDSEVIDRLVELGIGLVAMRCAGYNNIDMDYALGKVEIARVPDYSPYAVAEHAMAMLLTSVRRIHKAYIRTRDHNFSLKDMTGFDLHGKTVGVIGTGKIGRVFIDICRGFGMRVIAYDKYPDLSSDIEYTSLEELWKQSDVISLHCPLNDETKHIVNAESIGKMKPGVVLINTSRGGLIDSESLLEEIKRKRIGAACLDVYEEEADIFFNDYSNNILDDDILTGLIAMPNVIVTSHQAFLTQEALDNIADTTLSNIYDYCMSSRSNSKQKHQ